MFALLRQVIPGCVQLGNRFCFLERAENTYCNSPLLTCYIPLQYSINSHMILAAWLSPSYVLCPSFVTQAVMQRMSKANMG